LNISDFTNSGNQISLTINRAGADQIARHLLRVDALYKPSLSSRIDIDAYSQKLHERTIRFEAWVAEELIGLVASYSNQSKKRAAFVTNVSVLSDFQGLGIASNLMRQCIEYSIHLGLSQIELEVDQRSLPAIKLYKKLGFNTLCESGSTLTMAIKLVK
jgi:ribosomal protein S18 acetylase RimI-like enzyme